MTTRPLRALLVALAVGAISVVALGTPAHAQEGGEESGQEEGGHEDISHEAEECIHLLEDGREPEECHEAPSPILPETNELIWGTLSFALLFLALTKFAWPPLKKGMEDRTERIRTSIDEAEQAKTEAESVRDEYQRQLADARSEAARIIEEARQTGDPLRRDLAARAEAEANELRQRSAEQIAAERERILSEVQSQVATLAVELAEKVVEANLDRESNLRLIENYINSVGSGTRS